MLEEQPAQVSGGHAQPVGQSLDAAGLSPANRALANQPERSRYEPRRAHPGRRAGGRFRPTAKAGAEPGRFGGGGGRKVADVLVPGSASRTNRPAVDPSGRHADEEAAVDSRIARSARAIADALIQLHRRELTAKWAGGLVTTGVH